MSASLQIAIGRYESSLDRGMTPEQIAVASLLRELQLESIVEDLRLNTGRLQVNHIIQSALQEPADMQDASYLTDREKLQSSVNGDRS